MIARSLGSLDRSQKAKATRRSMACRGSMELQIQSAWDVAKSLVNTTDADLAKHTNRLRHFVRFEKKTRFDQLISLAAGAVIESVRRVLGIDLFDVQLHAGIVVASGAVAEMQTGEGKTLSGILPAYVKSLVGRGVHVVTPNAYLARRDQEKLSSIFQLLDVSTGLVHDDATSDENRIAYQADVTYGAAHCFGFDYLRDQVAANQASSGLGHQLYARIQQSSTGQRPVQRGLYAAIVDEADHVLIDDCVSPLILSSHSDEPALDAGIFTAALDFSRGLECSNHFYMDPSDRTVELSEAGYSKVYERTGLATDPRLQRPWHEYVVLLLRAQHAYRANVDYVIRDNKIKIVESSTGRIFEDRTWSEGLHQAVQAVESLPITAETSALAKITRQRYFRHYEFLSGMTGTAIPCEREFASVYGLAVGMIPLRTESRRVLLEEHLSRSKVGKWMAIAEETAREHRNGRPVLIGTSSIVASLEVAKCLEQKGLSFELLNGIQDADEASVIAKAGNSGAITVATNLAGRGTDIPLSEDARELGGLHVIVSERNRLNRVDRQLIGRGARCGDPGSARVFVSAEDDLVQSLAPWIGRAVLRQNDLSSRVAIKLAHRLFGIQKSQQRDGAIRRWRLLKLDQANEKLLEKTDTPGGCVSL
ncbi:preprotein translocase subunit SecA [Planctomycetes bacterium CA13]|uniref:Preprotein translocase subunit SecA n=1 Tax=Novipirellula herctigrandis TaxID=2527986 RepID=A0A5C5YP49_9BACT|nr:preprotein translocase subunit SecA [Planctomycetes bacterium CA13]